MIDGTKQFALKQKLNSLKRPLKQLNSKHFSHISIRAKTAIEELEMEQQILLSGGTTLKDVKLLRARAEYLMEAERLFFAQKTRCQLLQQGDRCSKFFHDLIKRTNRRNATQVLTKNDGLITTDGDEIATKFFQFYKNMLGRTVTRTSRDQLGEGSFVISDLKQTLVAAISTEEVRNALFDIEDEKSPGPDGYGSAFFKKAWDVVGCDLVDAVDEFFRTGRLLKQWNHVFIALVPKYSHANTVTDYRPISCCNVFNKIISKILANRIRPVIGVITDPAQTAFIQGRCIVDHIHLAQELLRKYNRKNASPRCILKVDLQKAYDTIHWDFIEEALRYLKFDNIFIGWLMECVSTTSFSVSINGQLHGFFKGKRELRQRDPLSPYLFTICIEILSRSIKLATTSPDFNFHPKCQPLGITHLAYADDLLLLSRGDTGSLNILMSCLHKFSGMAGLHANVQKSISFLLASQKVCGMKLYGLQVFNWEAYLLGTWDSIITDQT